MSSINTVDFTDNLFTLLKEAFEGPLPGEPSAFLDQGGGLFQTIERLTAEEASSLPRPGAPTIAAHCEHTRFYVDALYEFMRGATGKVDWKQSWLVSSVNAGQWQALQTALRSSYTTLLRHLESTEEWGDTPISEAMAIVTHTAYHLGAIRQLVGIVAHSGQASVDPGAA